jgi:hypothetical protein
MRNDHSQQATTNLRVRTLLGAAFALVCAFATVTHAMAQNVNSPDAIDTITPPVGNTAFLVAHAFGSQGYTCLPTSNGGTAWNTSPRPEATLFVKVFGQLVQVITHFASVDAKPNDFAPNPVPRGGSATWQSSLDTSKVWAQKVGGIPAGSDKSCPNTGSIDCLLLQSIGNQEGPTGGKLLAKVTFVQRLNTSGGAAPTTACTVGQTELRGYEADYVFFHGNE